MRAVTSAAARAAAAHLGSGALAGKSAAGVFRSAASTCGGASVRFASTGGSSYSTADIPAAESKPNYYQILGVARNATADEVKAAFREAAKKYHPDVLHAQRAARAKAAAAASTHASSAHTFLDMDPAAEAAADVEAFKLVNEAYSVLSDPALRREYDSDKFSRTALLKRRNEGWTGSEIVQQSGEYKAWTSANKGEVGSGSEESHEEAFKASMSRVSARYQEGLKSRASMARVNRAKVRADAGKIAASIAYRTQMIQ